VPYDQGDNPKSGSLKEIKAMGLVEAAEIVKDMKTQAIKDALAKGEVKDIVAMIAYLNRMK
jgi:cytochrome c oxidase cbb3-type subunit 2